jgi:hypothetical protein
MKENLLNWKEDWSCRAESTEVPQLGKFGSSWIFKRSKLVYPGFTRQEPCESMVDPLLEFYKEEVIFYYFEKL